MYSVRYVRHANKCGVSMNRTPSCSGSPQGETDPLTHSFEERAHRAGCWYPTIHNAPGERFLVALGTKTSPKVLPRPNPGGYAGATYLGIILSVLALDHSTSPRLRRDKHLSATRCGSGTGPGWERFRSWLHSKVAVEGTDGPT